jgi:hypothetical protein
MASTISQQIVTLPTTLRLSTFPVRRMPPRQLGIADLALSYAAPN